MERVLVAGNSGLVQKSAQDFEAAFDRPGRPFFPAQQAQQNFGVQILADFVDDPHILDERFGLVTGQHQRLVLQRARGFVAAARRRGSGDRQGGKAGELGVARLLPAVDCDAAHFKKLAKEAGGKFRGIFDGQGLVGAGIIQRHVAPKRQHRGARVRD